MPSFVRNHLPLLIAIVLAGLLGGGVAFVRTHQGSFAQTAPGARFDALVARVTSSTIERAIEPPVGPRARSDFFIQTRDRLISEQTRFIEANLSEMRIRVHEGGTVLVDVPIKTKGREGSWWETPVGLYAVASKETNHFSSFGKVYQPWSMAFQGNFFIHGWPYHPDGTPVASTYSGGCIRLTDDDAKAIYDVVRVGTPVLVYKDTASHATYTYDPAPASFDAPGYLVADLATTAVLATRQSSQTIRAGSMTSLMAALVAVEYLNIERSITVPADVITHSPSRLTAGESVSVYSLLHALLAEGDDDAAAGIASALGPKRFVALMNQKAAAIGMRTTSFTSIRFNDPGNQTTLEDAFALLRYLYTSRSFILTLTHRTTAGSVYGAPAFTDLRYRSGLVALPGFAGGVADADTPGGGASVFTVTITSTTRPLAIVLAGADRPTATIESIRRWITDTYE